jgi:hypothetical protein
MIRTMLQTVLDSNAQAAAAQEHAIALATQRLDSGMELVMTTISAAISSSILLQEKIVSPIAY